MMAARFVMPTARHVPQPRPQRAAVKLRAFHVVITMPDASKGEHDGLYGHSFDAWDRAAALFPEAVRIEVKPLAARRAAP
jgi:hypothetical protein